METLLLGEYPSAFRGTGVEPSGVRPYVPGDDVRSIDWNVTARTGRAYVKQHREERELLVWLLVDVSASGLFGPRGVTKRETAAEAAAVLAYSAARSNDRVGAILFTDRVERLIPPAKGSAHAWRVMQEIFTFAPANPGTDLAGCLRYFRRVARRRSVAFLISDFLDRGYRRDLAATARRHDVVGLVVTDPGEELLPEGGLVTVRDLETGATAVVDTGHAPSVRAYAALCRKIRRETADTLRRSGVDAVEISTREPPAAALHRYFLRRERRPAP